MTSSQLYSDNHIISKNTLTYWYASLDIQGKSAYYLRDPN